MFPSDTVPAALDEQRFVERLKKMDQQAWQDVLDIYAPTLHRDVVSSLRKRGLPIDQADDITQETWLVAVQKIGEFVCDGEDKFYHWLRAISLNHVRNLWRKQRKAVSLDDLMEIPSGLDHFLWANRLVADNPENEVALREQLSALDRALQKIKPTERELLLRRLLCNQKPDELAEHYPWLNSRSISQALFRAKKHVQNQLGEADKEKHHE